MLIASTFVAADNVIPEVGKSAPEFTLKSDEGKDVSLKDYRGKWVVLYFYPKDFTSGCTIEARNFQRDLALYEKAGAVIIGVSIDTAESHKGFCTKEGLNFRLLADTELQRSFPLLRSENTAKRCLPRSPNCRRSSNRLLGSTHKISKSAYHSQGENSFHPWLFIYVHRSVMGDSASQYTIINFHFPPIAANAAVSGHPTTGLVRRRLVELPEGAFLMTLIAEIIFLLDKI
jgi:peroxiredoxin